MPDHADAPHATLDGFAVVGAAGAALGVELPPEVAEEEGVSRRKPGPVFWISISWLVFVALVAILAPFLPLADPKDTLNRGAGKFEGFSSEHWLGTDSLGRDMLARVVEGSRVSLTIGFGAIAGGLLVGGTIGLLAGFRRGWLERVLMAATDVLLTFPPIVLALAIVTFVGREMKDIVLTLAILSIAPIARLARANTLQWSQREFVQAARVLGARDRTLMFREVLPNVVMPMGYLALIGVAIVIVAEGTLAFLGLGINNQISWGGMVLEGSGTQELEFHGHVAFVPCAAIFLTVLALNFAGERIRALSDIRESAL
ncbi:MAG: ABC transporter permease [Actinomycetota bacterium]